MFSVVNVLSRMEGMSFVFPNLVLTHRIALDTMDFLYDHPWTTVKLLQAFWAVWSHSSLLMYRHMGFPCNASLLLLLVVQILLCS